MCAIELVNLGEKPVAQIATYLLISQSCLRRWMDQASVEAGDKPDVTRDERAEPVELRRQNRVLEMEVKILKRGCRVIKVSPSTCYERRSRPASTRDVEDAYLIEHARAIDAGSRQTYGAPRSTPSRGSPRRS